VEGGKLLVLYQVKGKGTKLLTQARPGQELLAWGPLGRGFDLSAQNPVLVAGGMGIAPLAFLAERYGAKADEVRLLYGLPGKAGLDPLMDLLQKRLDPLNVTLSYSTEDGSFGVRGLVTFILKSILDDDSVSKPDLVHTCGPLPMLGAVSLLCADHGVPCQVSLEAPMACGVGACLGCAVPAAGGGYLRACQEGPVMDASSVDWERI
jgi:dihydroorotate dehydrogenase electron transfer subunit